MIIMTPTEHNVGINVQGDYYDFYEFVDAVHRLTGVFPDENYDDPYYAVSNRLLGLCYDIRHAMQGDRELSVRDNGLNTEIMKWHSLVMSDQTVYYSVNILFPEALFVAATAEKYMFYATRYYGKSGKKNVDKGEFSFSFDYTDYVRDCGVVRNFVAQIWGALGDVVGEVALENILTAQGQYESYAGYVAQYIDNFDFELIKAAPEKRPGKLKTMAKKIVVPDNKYYQLYHNLSYSAKEYGCSIHELHDPSLEFPETIPW